MSYKMSEKAINQRMKVIHKAQKASLLVNSLKQEKIDEIVKLRIEGLSHESICYLLKVCRNTVIKYCKQRGV